MSSQSNHSLQIIMPPEYFCQRNQHSQVIFSSQKHILYGSLPQKFQIENTLTVGIEFSCIQRRKYFGDSVSCRKCILCDRDATGALRPRIHTSGLDLCLCLCPRPKMHKRQAQKRNVVNTHFFMLFVEGQKLF